MSPSLCYPAVVSFLGSLVFLKCHLQNLRDVIHSICLTITSKMGGDIEKLRDWYSNCSCFFFLKNYRFIEPGLYAIPELSCSVILLNLFFSLFLQAKVRNPAIVIYYPSNLNLIRRVIEKDQCNSMYPQGV